MTDTPTVRGRPADVRIIDAVRNLVDQFGICGLKAPIAIVVAPGQKAALATAISESDLLLFEDVRAVETSVWGVKIVEPPA